MNVMTEGTKERRIFGLAVLSHEVELNGENTEGSSTPHEEEKNNITPTEYVVRMYRICGHVCIFTYEVVSHHYK